jgi:hypothetical protein
MLPVHHKPPEQMPPHYRDYPVRHHSEGLGSVSASQGLGLLVVAYLVAMFAGILLLGQLTQTALPPGATAMSSTRD